MGITYRSSFADWIAYHDGAIFFCAKADHICVRAMDGVQWAYCWQSAEGVMRMGTWFTLGMVCAVVFVVIFAAKSGSHFSQEIKEDMIEDESDGQTGEM